MRSRQLRSSESGAEPAASGDEVNASAVLSPAEIRKLLDTAPAGYYRTLFSTAFITGMRSGELLALRWSDIEFGDGGRGKVYVRRSLSWSRVDRGEAVRPRFYPPKTKAGLRTITIAPELVAALKLWKLQCPPGELVFPHADGQPNCRDRILMVGLYPALRRAGLRRVNFHSLRHSCASAMIAAGAPITRDSAPPGPRVAGHHVEGLLALLQGCRDGYRGSSRRDSIEKTGRGRKWAKSGH